MENNLIIYTDGSSAPSPRRGGGSFRIIFPDGTTETDSSYKYIGATNNEMELQACVFALKRLIKLNDLKGARGIIICTDSQYIVNHYKDAMFKWPTQKWMRSNGEPVLNTLIWKDIIRLMKNIGVKFHVQVNFEKVEAHSGIRDNEDVDKLAKKAREGIEAKNKISITRVRRSRTKGKTVRGSIKGDGQKIRLYVITAKLVRPQNIYQLRCEVLSKKSKYFRMTDFVISEFFMTAGHTYDVLLFEGLDYCKVKKVIKEAF